MKKTAITLLLAAVAASAGAQTMYDALTFSENDYAGTARTLAMGNAFTALGGDLGSLSINPAGSAVAKYSQITVTPGMAISVNKANGTLAGNEDFPSSFGSTRRNTKGSFWMPNIGFTVNFDTHRTSGIKNVSIGVVANVSNTYKDGLYAKGLNTRSSFAGGMATMAYGFHPDNLSGSDAYDLYPADWQYILAYQSYMISPVEDGSTEYAGVTENIYRDADGKITGIEIPGSLNQTFGRSVKGNRYDYLINLGMNISDFIYIGANLGITSLRYSSEEYFIETPEEYSLFQTGFQKLSHNSVYKASGTGVYGKFGIIATPFGGLRIGAAIQTPTANMIKETWYSSASVVANSQNTGKSETPEGQYDYRLSSPMRFNVGAAYTFGGFAAVSADYEMCNYGKMRLTERQTADNSGFDAVNEDIRDFMGKSHMFRAGIEVKPVSQFAVRAGYGLTTAPDYWYFDEAGVRTKLPGSDIAKTHKYSFGLGYSSQGSFFMDLAVTAKKYAKEYIAPYVTAMLDNNGQIMTDENGIPVADYNTSPEILNRKWLWTATVTFGFRF
ncbi:MAG: hypothetical protein NC115_01675 [Bacteroidales bacterium]|nr:hypothetical protein [Bacteroidales bacterium]